MYVYIYIWIAEKWLGTNYASKLVDRTKRRKIIEGGFPCDAFDHKKEDSTLGEQALSKEEKWAKVQKATASLSGLH